MECCFIFKFRLKRVVFLISLILMTYYLMHTEIKTWKTKTKGVTTFIQALRSHQYKIQNIIPNKNKLKTNIFILTMFDLRLLEGFLEKTLNIIYLTNPFDSIDVLNDSLINQILSCHAPSTVQLTSKPWFCESSNSNYCQTFSEYMKFCERASSIVVRAEIHQWESLKLIMNKTLNENKQLQILHFIDDIKPGQFNANSFGNFLEDAQAICERHIDIYLYGSKQSTTSYNIIKKPDNIEHVTSTVKNILQYPNLFGSYKRKLLVNEMKENLVDLNTVKDKCHELNRLLASYG